MDMNDKDRFEEIVSSALEKQTEFELSPDFADRVVSMIQQKAVQKETQRDRWWLISGIASMIGALVYVFTKIELKSLIPNVEIAPISPGVGVFTFLSGYSGLVIFGIAFVIALNFLDKRILRRHQ